MRQSSAETFSTLLQAGAATSFLLTCIVAALIAYFARRSIREIGAVNARLTSANAELMPPIHKEVPRVNFRACPLVR
jgi:hypothetical protein